MKSGDGRVSVVIVDYKAKEFLEKLIRSINRYSSCIEEIVVVDNNPRPLDLDMRERIRTIVIRPGGNVGFTRGNNMGFSQTNENFVLFLNPDMLFLNDVAGILLGKLKDDKQIGVVGPKFENEDGSHQVSTRCFPTIRFAISRFIPYGRLLFKKEQKRYYDTSGSQGEERFVDTISTGAFMIRRDVFSRLKGFDENTFMYAEDAELCKRIRDMGLRVLYYPEARLLHYGGQSSRLASKTAIFSYYHSFYYLYKKHVVGKWMILLKPLFWLLPRVHLAVMFFKKDKRLTWSHKK